MCCIYKNDKILKKFSIRVGNKVCVSRHFKDGPLYKAFQKFDGPYRVIEALKLNKHRIRDMLTGRDMIEHQNYLKTITRDVDSFVLDNTNKTVSLQDEESDANCEYSLHHHNDLEN